MDHKITLFDITGRSPVPYSPNTWKVRLALNYKGLTYSTRYTEIVDIEDTCKSLGIPPSGTKPTGKPHYTFPAIIDDTDPHGLVKMSDSRPIIEYLERTYPPEQGKELFPEGRHDFQDQAQQIVLTRILSHAPFLWLSDLYRLKTPKDQENIKMRMEGMFGKPMEEIVATGAEWQRHWHELQEAFSGLESLSLTHATGDGPFMLGRQLTFSDIILGALLICLKNSASEEQWSQIASWNNSRWNRLLQALQPWTQVDNYQVWRD